jgi:hypothetical protein
MSRQKLSEKFPTDEAGLSATDTKAGKLQRACLDLLREHERDGAIPTNAKFLFYEAEQRGVVPKHYLDERGHKKPRQPLQDITDALTYLRERDIIPWWCIEDPSRVLDDWMFATSVYAYVADAMGRARIDVWKGEPPPLYLFESPLPSSKSSRASLGLEQMSRALPIKREMFKANGCNFCRSLSLVNATLPCCSIPTRLSHDWLWTRLKEPPITGIFIS